MDNPTLGELEREGKLGSALAQLYGRLLGGDWRTCRVSEAHQALAYERRRHELGIDLRSAPLAARKRAS